MQLKLKGIDTVALKTITVIKKRYPYCLKESERERARERERKRETDTEREREGERGGTVWVGEGGRIVKKSINLSVNVKK